jgi:hypothetical protein
VAADRASELLSDAEPWDNLREPAVLVGELQSNGKTSTRVVAIASVAAEKIE